MATEAEVLELARRFARHEFHLDVQPGAGMWDALTDEERRRCLAYTLYEMQRRTKPEQRKALRLFRSWLTENQRQQLRTRQDVMVRGSAGGMYRINPYCGATERVERHGKRWFARTRFCYHDPAGELPKADVALGHLLLIRADEPEFILRANEHVSSGEMWSSAYRRRLAVARRFRIAAGEEAA